MNNKELINNIDQWSDDIRKHLKDVRINARTHLCVTLSNMLEFNEKLKKECEEECQLEKQA